MAPAAEKRWVDILDVCFGGRGGVEGVANGTTVFYVLHYIGGLPSLPSKHESLPYEGIAEGKILATRAAWEICWCFDLK